MELILKRKKPGLLNNKNSFRLSKLKFREIKRKQDLIIVFRDQILLLIILETYK